MFVAGAIAISQQLSQSPAVAPISQDFCVFQSRRDGHALQDSSVICRACLGCILCVWSAYGYFLRCSPMVFQIMASSVAVDMGVSAYAVIGLWSFPVRCRGQGEGTSTSRSTGHYSPLSRQELRPCVSCQPLRLLPLPSSSAGSVAHTVSPAEMVSSSTPPALSRCRSRAAEGQPDAHAQQEPDAGRSPDPHPTPGTYKEPTRPPRE